MSTTDNKSTSLKDNEDVIIPESIHDLSEKSNLDDLTQKRLFKEEKVIYKEHQKKILKLKKNIQIFGGIGGAIILLVAGFYIIPSFFTLQETRNEITSLNKTIDTMEVEKITDNQSLKEKNEEKTALENEFGEILPLILPEIHSTSEYQSSINRMAMFFEEFSIHPGKGYSPLHLPSISFGKPKEKDGVFVIPIDMTIEADRKSFNLFLDQINNKSGSFNPDDFYYSKLSQKREPIPIMSIDSLNISLPTVKQASFQFIKSSLEKKNDKEKNLSFSVSLSAYFKATDKMKELYGGGKKRKR